MSGTLPDLELVSHHLCPYVQRAVITLAEKQVSHRRSYIDLADKPAWFREIAPLGRVPLLRVGEAVLFESAVICEYLDEITPGSLHPAGSLEKAQHRAWIEFASGLLDEIARYYNAPDQERFFAARARIAERFARLEDQLGEGPFFAGARFSLVDAAFAPVFRYVEVFESVDAFEVFAATPRLRAWRSALAERPSVRDAVAADYPQRLLDFLARRESHLARRLAGTAAA